MATISTQKSPSARKNTQNIVICNDEDFIAKIVASNHAEPLSVLAKMHLGAEMAEIWDLNMHPTASSLRALAEAQQDAFIMPYILFVTDRGTPSSHYQQNFTQEQSAALSRPHRHFVQLELGHDYPAVKIVTSSSTAGLEGRLSRYELGYNRETLRDENRTHNLMAEMELLGHSLCSLLLQPMAKPGSREQTRRQIVDAVRDARTDVMAAEAEVKVQTIHEKSTERVLDPGVSDYPMTAGHVEIQAVNEAAKEVSNAVLSLNNVIKDLPSQLSQDHQALLHGNLDSVSRGILRFPAYLTSLLVRRMAELDATRKDKDAAAETLGAAEKKMAAAEAKQIEVVAMTEAFERDKCVAGGKMREAAELLQAVETREKLVSGRERRIVRLEEERALEDLNHGANAAMEDEAEAAAAEARESQHSISPILGLTAAVKNEQFPTNLEKISSCPSVGEHVLLGRGTAIAAKEEELWHRENNLAFRETNLHHRETAIFAREQLLEQMKFAQIQLTDNWKAQVDISYAGLEAEGEDLGAKFRALIALKGRVEETQAKVRSLIGEARGMVRVGGRDEGEDKEA